jgi:hypothetical protein
LKSGNGDAARVGYAPRRYLNRSYLAWVLIGFVPAVSAAQMDSNHRDIFHFGAQAIGVVTRESPAIHGTDLTEGYLTQPVAMTELQPWGEKLSLKLTLNFEGETLERGELNAGIYGEGYIDRRHPHTYLHELIATSSTRFGSGSSGFSLTVGKGFAPFGTDDPMSRPFEKYPINHHLAQILERAVAIGAVRGGPWIFEVGSFNGDEPTGPGDNPNSERYFDSWSTRLTFVPWPQGEFQASYARVKSPENAAGGGADQRKRSASIRLEDVQHTGYALFEWARTTDYAGSTPSFSYYSFLAETWAKYDRLNGAFRVERTERPDEERLSDEFRTAVPPNDLSIAGRSRWTILAARLAADLVNAAQFGAEPFVEVAWARVSPTIQPTAFDPKQFYGSSSLWSISAGAKLTFGMRHMRMGRYGVAVAGNPELSMAGMHMHHM